MDTVTAARAALGHQEPASARRRMKRVTVIRSMTESALNPVPVEKVNPAIDAANRNSVFAKGTTKATGRR
jgi:hypothetical protein